MDLRRTLVALLSGVAAFLLVGIAVTAALESRIEFSVFIGLPAGFVAAIVVTALVAFLLADPAKQGYAVGAGIGAAGLVVVLGTVVGVAFRYRLSTVLWTVAILGGVIATIAVVLTGRTGWTVSDQR